MKVTKQLVVMALLGQASANETQRQMELHKNSNHKHMSVKGRQVGAPNNYQQSQSRQDDDDTIAESDAKMQEINAARADVEFRQRFNPYDGSFHNSDGSRQFFDGGEIGGVNNYPQNRMRARDEDDTIQEQEARESEINQFKVIAADNENKRKEEERQQEFKRRFNTFDGLYHNPDGSRQFTPDGPSVEGVNNYHQNPEDLEAQDQTNQSALRDTEAMARQNPFDGHIHNTDRTRTFMDGSGVVGGVNDYLKTHSRPAQHRHMHHHQTHSSRDIDSEPTPVPEPLTKADKAALKRDNARAKAEIEINKAKIEEANSKIESNSNVINQEKEEIKAKVAKKDAAEEVGEVVPEDKAGEVTSNIRKAGSQRKIAESNDKIEVNKKRIAEALEDIEQNDKKIEDITVKAKKQEAEEEVKQSKKKSKVAEDPIVTKMKQEEKEVEAKKKAEEEVVHEGSTDVVDGAVANKQVLKKHKEEEENEVYREVADKIVNREKQAKQEYKESVKKAEENGDDVPIPRQINNWDGHYHNSNGSKEFFDGDGIVGGVNSHVHLKNRHHHVHHHQMSTPGDVGVIDDAIPPPVVAKQVEKKALKKDNAKAEAEIVINQEKIDTAKAKIEENAKVIETEKKELEAKKAAEGEDVASEKVSGKVKAKSIKKIAEAEDKLKVNEANIESAKTEIKVNNKKIEQVAKEVEEVEKVENAKKGIVEDPVVKQIKKQEDQVREDSSEVVDKVTAIKKIQRGDGEGAQSQDSQEQADKIAKIEAEEASKPPAKKRVVNQWTGHYHNADGSKDFFDGDGVVGGINRHAQIKKNHHHHGHHHKMSSPDAGTVDEVVSPPVVAKQVEKTALKKDNAKAKAEIEINQEKIDAAKANIEENAKVIEDEKKDIQSKKAVESDDAASEVVSDKIKKKSAKKIAESENKLKENEQEIEVAKKQIKENNKQIEKVTQEVEAFEDVENAKKGVVEAPAVKKAKKEVEQVKDDSAEVVDKVTAIKKIQRGDGEGAQNQDSKEQAEKIVESTEKLEKANAGVPPAKKKVINQWTGHFDNADGSKDFFDGNGVVGGVNNRLHQKNHNKHHNHVSHSKIDDLDDLDEVPPTSKSVIAKAKQEARDKLDAEEAAEEAQNKKFWKKVHKNEEIENDAGYNINPLDGLYHKDDDMKTGKRDFAEGGDVAGVNNYLKSHTKKQAMKHIAKYYDAQGEGRQMTQPKKKTKSFLHFVSDE